MGPVPYFSGENPPRPSVPEVSGGPSSARSCQFLQPPSAGAHLRTIAAVSPWQVAVNKPPWPLGCIGKRPISNGHVNASRGPRERSRLNEDVLLVPRVIHQSESGRNVAPPRTIVSETHRVAQRDSGSAQPVPFKARSRPAQPALHPVGWLYFAPCSSIRKIYARCLPSTARPPLQGAQTTTRFPNRRESQQSHELLGPRGPQLARVPARSEVDQGAAHMAM